MGEAVYLKNGRVCMGRMGGRWARNSRADAAASGLMDPRDSAPGTDMFRFIRDGVPGMAMVPLGSQLSDEGMWHVVNYIKALGK